MDETRNAETLVSPWPRWLSRWVPKLAWTFLCSVVVGTGWQYWVLSLAGLFLADYFELRGRRGG